LKAYLIKKELSSREEKEPKTSFSGQGQTKRKAKESDKKLAKDMKRA